MRTSESVISATGITGLMLLLDVALGRPGDKGHDMTSFKWNITGSNWSSQSRMHNLDLKELRIVLCIGLAFRWDHPHYANKSVILPACRIKITVAAQTSSSGKKCDDVILLLDDRQEHRIELRCPRTSYGRFVRVEIEPDNHINNWSGSPQLTLCDVDVLTASPADDWLLINNSVSPLEEPYEAINDTAGDYDDLLEDDARSLDSQNTIHSRRENATKMGFGGLLRRMQNLFPDATTKEQPLADVQEPDAGDDDNTYQSYPSGQVTWADDVIQKLDNLRGYALFSGIIAGILLLSVLALGIFIFWGLFCHSSAKETSPEPIQHDFVYHAPSPTPIQLSRGTLDRSNILSAKESRLNPISSFQEIF